MATDLKNLVETAGRAVAGAVGTAAAGAAAALSKKEPRKEAAEGRGAQGLHERLPEGLG
ncbi:MAG TPA: hypothetical protein VJ797_03070 [Burkholderiales bacterium]|nr:hypothetical protein [Burkholderiales bacterium]